MHKIEEKKNKSQRIKDEKKERQKKNESKLSEDNSKIILEEEFIRKNIISNISVPVYVVSNDYRIKKKKYLEKKKKKISSIQDHFLYEVYGSHPSKGLNGYYKDYSGF